MADGDIGVVTLHNRANLLFSVRYWKGKPYAHIRKFIHSKKYEGPTKSGLSLDEAELIDLLAVLHRLYKETPRADDYQYSKVGKYKGTDIIISIIKPDGPTSLPSIDIREFVQTPKYTGPTKKGIRFPWDKLSEVMALLQIQSQRIVKGNEIQPKLFPGPTLKPGNKEDIVSERTTQNNETFTKICPNGLLKFPGDFIRSQKQGKQIGLPSETIEITTQIDGTCLVRSDLGFCYPVRNAVEGKFMVYCWFQGHRNIYIPGEMIEIFKAVKEYENYLREIRRALIQEYERKSGSRPTAEYQVKEIFKNNGLPWLEHS